LKKLYLNPPLTYPKNSSFNNAPALLALSIRIPHKPHVAKRGLLYLS
jgi:hypothetical protein